MTKLAIIALCAALLYGAMSALGSHGFPGLNSGASVTGHVVHVVLEDTVGWFPSFLAGLVAGKRAVLLGVLTIVVGTVSAIGFQDLLTPAGEIIVIDDWDPASVNFVQAVLALAVSGVGSVAGQSISKRMFSNKQPIAREDVHSG